jgi:hypothetical protein
MISTAFNIYAMRRGALIIGAGAQPLRRDLRRIPGLLVHFTRDIVTAVARAARTRMRIA